METSLGIKRKILLPVGFLRTSRLIFQIAWKVFRISDLKSFFFVYFVNAGVVVAAAVCVVFNFRLFSIYTKREFYAVFSHSLSRIVCFLNFIVYCQLAE